MKHSLEMSLADGRMDKRTPVGSAGGPKIKIEHISGSIV